MQRKLTLSASLLFSAMGTKDHAGEPGAPLWWSSGLETVICCASREGRLRAVCYDGPGPSDFHCLRDGQRIFEFNA